MSIDSQRLRASASATVATAHMAWRVSKLLTSVVATALFAAATIPTAFVMVSARLVDELREPPGARLSADAIALLVFLGLLVAARQVLMLVLELAAYRLGLLVDARLRGQLLSAATAVQLWDLETPTSQEALEGAAGVWNEHYTPAHAAPALASVTAARLGGAGLALVVAVYRPWLAALLVLAWGVVHRWLDREAQTLLQTLSASTDGLRRARYLRSVLLDPAAAPDVRVLGAHRWLLNAFRCQWMRGMEEVWQRRHRHRRLAMVSGGLLAAAYGTLGYVVGRGVVRGALSPGDATRLLGAGVALSSLGWLGEVESFARYGAAGAQRAQVVARQLRTGALVAPRQEVDALPLEEIRFESVWFTYPETERPVLKGLDLVLNRQTSVGMVGRNGSGKTTLIKLLARLYEPDDGRITVDGVDLRDLDAVVWRTKLAIVFQDFLRLPVTLRENLAAGRKSDDRLLWSALADSAAGFSTSLPQGLDTLLTPAYTGGRDLSGGEWQKVALARSFFELADAAQFLVLDEPTAHLDVRSETLVFDRVLSACQEKGVFLISHRFGTVRKAQRIHVLDRGRVIERGTHEELLDQGGLYAHMFSLQANRLIDVP